MTMFRSIHLVSLFAGSMLTLSLGANTTVPPISCEERADSLVISCQSALASVRLERIGTYRAGFFNSKSAEIVAHDPVTQRLFVVNVADVDEDLDNPPPPTVDVLDIEDPSNPELAFAIDLSNTFPGARTVPTSVAVQGGLVAVAVTNDEDEAGKALFYDTDGKFLNDVATGGNSDMVTFTPDGLEVLVANPGSLLSLGSISVIDLSKGVEQATVTNADFSDFNDDREELIAAGVRIFPRTNVDQSLRPEYIAVSSDSLTAWVTLEINNALAVVDIKGAEVTQVLPLGVKDHNQANNGFVGFDGKGGNNAVDGNDNDEIDIKNSPVFSYYQADAIAAYNTSDNTYLVTANEGAHLELDLGLFEFDERIRIEDLIEDGRLDATVFPDPENTLPTRLNVSRLYGDTNGDGLFDKLFAFGARSFSIWSLNGQTVFDSGYDFEQITAAAATQLEIDNIFNPEDSENDFDNKSDDRGPEPEGITVGNAYERTYAFTVLERTGGIMVYDVTEPTKPGFQQYINNRDFRIEIKGVCEKGKPESEDCAKVGDLAPEGVLFIPEANSPIDAPLVVTANETSGSTTIYRIDEL